MLHSRRVAFHGDVEKAIDAAAAGLMLLGFNVTQRGQAEVELAGPGMTSSKQHPLMGASWLRLERTADELTVEADLGGLRFLTRFILIFPAALLLGMLVMLTIVFGLVFGNNVWIPAVAGVIAVNAAVWIILGPLLIRRLQARTCRAVDDLLEKVALMGQM